MITCPFCSCSCCRWQHFSARRAASNNPRPGSVRGFFYALIAAGRPRSPQEPPSALQSCAPARMYARPPLAPPAPVLARRGYACAVPAAPAEYTAPLTMPLQGVMSGFYIPHTSDRVSAFLRVLRPSGASCDAVRIVTSRGMCSRPPRISPEAAKVPARRQATFRPHFRAGFYSVFARVREGIPISLYAPDSRWHSRCHSRLIVA